VAADKPRRIGEFPADNADSPACSGLHWGQEGHSDDGALSAGQRRNTRMMSKSELIQKVADESSLAKKDVKAVMEGLAAVAYKELRKSGTFMLPGFAKFIVVKKPATKERQGINPFTKEPTIFKAKPARKMLRVRPVKAAKDAV
jgi:nucleoid DNA-binding protein